MKTFVTNNEVQGEYVKGAYGLHGDVVLHMETLPEEFESWTKVEPILALGEATGHIHKVFGECECRENPVTKERHLKVVEPCSLRHQEHLPIKLPPGSYRIGIQKEYDHFEKLTREVFD